MPLPTSHVFHRPFQPDIGPQDSKTAWTHSRGTRHAYRPETGADVIQSWYDWAWFAFLLGWIYLAIEMFATAAVELMDDRPEPMIPRWLTWLTIAGAAMIFCAAGPAFFKSGPFAYHGLLAFYMPVVIWGGYIALTTWYMMKELKRAPELVPEPASASDRS